jgi:hypothetical protein
MVRSCGEDFSDFAAVAATSCLIRANRNCSLLFQRHLRPHQAIWPQVTSSSLVRWYVADVSIIFDAPCLFYTNCFVFCLHFVAFYAFSGTNQLMRCHNASSYFLLFLCFRKVTQEIFSELDETKAEVPIYLKGRRSPEERRSWTRRRPHHRVAWATPWPRHQVVWAPGLPSDIALPPINSLRRKNPKGPNTFPQNILQAAAVVVPRSRGSKSSSRHPA